MRAPSIGFDRRSLGLDKRRTAHREPTQMDGVPSIRIAIFGAVLTHRRNRDTVLELLIAQGERRKETAHEDRLEGYEFN